MKDLQKMILEMKSANKQFHNFLKSEPVLDFCKIRSYF